MKWNWAQPLESPAAFKSKSTNSRISLNKYSSKILCNSAVTWDHWQKKNNQKWDLRKYLQNKSNSLIIKCSGNFSSIYKIVYSILNLITLHTGRFSNGLWENNENPSNINSCWSCSIMVGVFICGKERHCKVQTKSE